MDRRGLLACAGAGTAIPTPGCLSTIPTPTRDTPTPSAEARCSDRKFPDRHLGVIALEESERPTDPPTVIRYADLPPGEQSIVQGAIERGRYAICLPAASPDHVDQFSSLVDRIEENTLSVQEGAILERDGSYYRFTHVRTEDQVYVTAHA